MTTKISQNLLSDDYVLSTGDTMTGNLTISSNTPVLFINETDATTDNKLWAISPTTEELLIQARTDVGAGGDNLFAFARTLNQINQFYAKAAGVAWLTIDNTTKKITSTTTPTNPEDLSRKDYIDDNFVSLAGDTMTGTLFIKPSSGTAISDIAALDGISSAYLSFSDSTSTLRSAILFDQTAGVCYWDIRNSGGTTLTRLQLETNGNVNMTTGAAAPTSTSHLTRKDYVDTKFSNRNVIINGNFDVWQRGTSFAAIPNVTFMADRFSYDKNGDMVHTVSQSTDVPTYAQSGTKSNYSVLLDVTTADVVIDAAAHCSIQYKVEGYDYARIAGGDATLSFWVKAAKTGVHCVTFRNVGNDRSYVTEFTVDVADTWEKITVTVPLTETAGTWDYVDGVGLRVNIVLATGTTLQTTKDTWQTGNYLATSSQVNEVDSTANSFRIAQVQFEKSDVATPFEFKSYTDELSKCQRYYWEGLLDGRGGGYAYGTAGATLMLVGSVSFPTTMREVPIVILETAGVTTNCTYFDAIESEHGLHARATVTANGTYRILDAVFSADAEL